jgi:hypothetical protein
MTRRALNSSCALVAALDPAIGLDFHARIGRHGCVTADVRRFVPNIFPVLLLLKDDP